MNRHEFRGQPIRREKWLGVFTPCIVPGCETRAVAKGMCETHRLKKKNGEPLISPERKSGHGTYGAVTRGPDWVQCDDCGKLFKRLENHIIKQHESVESYRQRHGLLQSEALLCENLIKRFRETANARIGTEDWETFTQRRDETQHINVKKATAAGVHGVRRKPKPRKTNRLSCPICGEPSGMNTRDRYTCSEACWLESKIRGIGKREAKYNQEPTDFQRRPGEGEQLRRPDVVKLLNISTSTFQRMIKRGDFPAHAGRTNAVAWWWQQEVLAWKEKQMNARIPGVSFDP